MKKYMIHVAEWCKYFYHLFGARHSNIIVKQGWLTLSFYVIDTTTLQTLATVCFYLSQLEMAKCGVTPPSPAWCLWYLLNIPQNSLHRIYNQIQFQDSRNYYLRILKYGLHISRKGKMKSSPDSLIHWLWTRSRSSFSWRIILWYKRWQIGWLCKTCERGNVMPFLKIIILNHDFCILESA